MRGAAEIDAMLVVVVVLYARPGAEEAFADFEEQALAILREHGGRLERAVRPVRAADAPHDIHVLTFPSQSVFDAYRGIRRLAVLASLRQSAVEKTVLWSGPDASVEYGGE